YRRVLDVSLRWRWSILIVSLSLFAVSLLLIRVVRQEFVPAQDQDFIIVQAQAPTGSSLKYTEQVSFEVEKILKSVPEIYSFVITIGAGGPNSQVNQIFAPVALQPKKTREASHI